jgi:hypothetical protein
VGLAVLGLCTGMAKSKLVEGTREGWVRFVVMGGLSGVAFWFGLGYRRRIAGSEPKLTNGGLTVKIRDEVLDSAWD